MRMEEAASGIDCQETKLHKVLEEIREKEKAATDARSLQDGRAVERLGQTKKRNAEKQDEKAQMAKKGRRSTSEVVQFLKEKSERESVLRKEDLELRRKELSQKEDMMKMLAQQQQQQAQLMLCQCLQRAKIRRVKYPLFYPSKCWFFDREKVLRQHTYFPDMQ